MSGKRKRLLFVSTRFLLPIDSGGKVRTCQILRGMKGQELEITLLSPATKAELDRYSIELESLCDHFLSWMPSPRNERIFHYTRLRHAFDRLPIPVRTDWSSQAAEAVSNALANEPDVVVFDFLHAAVLRPPRMECPSVLFTHNVEAEIFERHAVNARNPVVRSLWRGQHRKMREFEAAALTKFDVVVAVSERDASRFREEYGVERPHVIPTGVDLDYYSYSDPKRSNDVVFLGSMDWLPNQDAIRYFMEEVWSGIARSVPSARMTVVGRAPPAGLINRARSAGLEWSFTGFVDDVRPHVRAAAVCVIPIRIGGGTRLKVFEAMAMGIPVVSTSVGVEGLAIRDREHFLAADTPGAFEKAVTELLGNEAERIALARRARRFVQERYSHLIAARAFSAGCHRAMERSN